MTGYMSSGNDPISRVSIASLQDLGYEVNYNAADNFSFNSLSSSSPLNQNISYSSSKNNVELASSSIKITANSFPDFNGNKYINHLETSLNIIETPISIKLEGEINWKSTNIIRFYEISTEENYLVELIGDFNKNEPAHTEQLKGTVNEINFYKNDTHNQEYIFESSIDVQTTLENWTGYNLDQNNLIESRSLGIFNDTIYSGLGDDIVIANKGDDFINGGQGDDRIYGGEGIDTISLSSTFSDYSFIRNDNELQIADQRIGTNDGTDILIDIEYIQFSDQTVEESQVDIVKTYSGNFSDYKFYNKGNGVYEIKTDSGYDDITGFPLLTFTGESTTSSFRDVSAIVDIKGTFDQVTGLNTDDGKMFRLYNASFKRLPDPDGLKYWIDKYTSGENDERTVASSFLVSDEFKERYGANVSDTTYVNNLYQNVLGRLPDSSGLNYWLGQLNSGAETRYEVLLGFSESAENKVLFTEMTGFG